MIEASFPVFTMRRLFHLSPLLILIVGCSSNKAPVRGQLVYKDGSPVTGMENGQVVFEPEDLDTANTSASGYIDAQGRFELATEKPGDGVLIGRHRVCIVQNMPASDVRPPKVLAEKYERFATSGIVLEVLPGKKNEFTILVEPYTR